MKEVNEQSELKRLFSLSTSDPCIDRIDKCFNDKSLSTLPM